MMAFFGFTKFCVVFATLFNLSNAENNVDPSSSPFSDSVENLQVLLQEIILKNLQPFKCVLIMTDDVNRILFQNTWFKRFGPFVSFIMINVDESEDTLIPSNSTADGLMMAKNDGCQMYIILISNGIQVSRLLRYGDRYRVLNTRANFVFLYDNWLFDKKMFYIWKRIVNVIFIREYSGKKNSDQSKKIPWFELVTVPFPSPITSILVPRRVDIWTKFRFRIGAELFKDKTLDLKNQTLKVVVFSHIPGTVKVESSKVNNVRAVISNQNSTLTFMGVEIEILQTVANAMNFRCEMYEAENSDVELWGRRLVGNKYTGLIGEINSAHADIALGDIYYTPYFLKLMDLSVPYNTECLTFLTPEALTDNSWKTLILPFTGIMWASVLVCLLICSLVFHLLARFHAYISRPRVRDQLLFNIQHRRKLLHLSLCQQDPDVKYSMMRDLYEPPKLEGLPVGLYQFTEGFNSVLYTYSMLLLVSLPKLPTGWSLRMLTGWYWLYCLLLVVAYRASMTAILARPAPRVTIDTLQDLLSSGLPCGGWGEINKDFFEMSLDPSSKLIGEKFEIVNNSDDAVDRVAAGKFAFYENSYFLKEASVKRQLRYQSLKTNSSMDIMNDTQKLRKDAVDDRQLHIMTDCVIKMPISLGLQKNSPIKLRVDKYIRRVLEAGLVKKWLDDIMQETLTAEIHGAGDGREAIMNMKKFFGALVALLIGYTLSIIALIVEIVYFRYFVMRKPEFNKYANAVVNTKKLK